jgi:hypothetical protein
MFNEVIRVTPFTTETADICFRNITGDSLGGDVSFVASLRAFLAPRMGETESISLRLVRAFTKPGSDERFLGSNPSIESNMQPHSLLIVDVGVRCEDDTKRDALMAGVRKEFEATYSTYHAMNKVNAWFAKYLPVAAFCDEERQSTVLFVYHLSLRIWHFIQSATLSLVPWFFNKDEPVPPEDNALMWALVSKEPADYQVALEKMSQRYDFRGKYIHQMLDSFETKSAESAKASVVRSISNQRDSIETYKQSIGEALQSIRDLSTRLMGLESLIKSGSQSHEMADYFEANRSLELMSVSQNYVDFCVYDYLTYWEEEMAERVIDNRNSLVYDGDRWLSDDQKEMLANAIFEDRVLKVRMCASYRINTGTCRVTGLNSYAEDKVTSYMPNPHIHYHGCLGNYEVPIVDGLQSGNYIGVVEQCAASARSLAFGDSTVLGEFFRDLYKRDGKKYLEDKSGKLCTVEEAVAWLASQSIEEEKGA